MRTAAFRLTFASVAVILVSITASQVLLGFAATALLLSRLSLRLPPIRLPLALFLAWTLISVAASPDPHAGLPQVVKFLVFVTIPAVFSTFLRADVRRLTLAWTVLGCASALVGFWQFWTLRGDYARYVVARPSGFMSHWMTFGGEGMIVLAMLTAFLLLAPPAGPRQALAGFAASALIGFALVLNGSRNAWFGAAVALAYLLWQWRRWGVLLLPVAAGAAMLLAPAVVRQRASSIARPDGRLDSNQHRRATFLTGIEMIKAHPLFGVGPERVGRVFDAYVPAGVIAPRGQFYGHLHNIYLQYAAERGIPALIFLLWMMARILIDFRRAASTSTGEPRAVLHGSIAVVLAVLVAGLAEHNLGDSEVLTMFLTVVSCGYLAAESPDPVASV